MGRCLVGTWAVLAIVAGCAPWRPPPVGPLENPVVVAQANKDYVWDQIVDVVDDYFPIDREERIRLENDWLTVGRIDTAFVVGATVLEPFHFDSANAYERLESTLQTIRRRATVEVEPSENGYLVEVTVLKELEDLPRPEFATAGRATLRHDTSSRHAPPSAGTPAPAVGWIPQGRDPALEQRILGDIVLRLGRG